MVWKYKAVLMVPETWKEIQPILNFYSEQGWELSHVTDSYLFFKIARP